MNCTHNLHITTPFCVTRTGVCAYLRIIYTQLITQKFSGCCRCALAEEFNRKLLPSTGKLKEMLAGATSEIKNRVELLMDSTRNHVQNDEYFDTATLLCSLSGGAGWSFVC